MVTGKVVWQRRKDGEEFLAWVEIAEVRDSQDERTHYVWVLDDITDKKRAEQELRYLANYDTLTGCPIAPCCQNVLAERSCGHDARGEGSRCCFLT